MADAYLGEIRVFSGNFAPDGWALCNGQLFPIAQYSALFSVIGAQYGGNGQSNFAIPNLLGRAPMHQGTGAGLTPRVVGEYAGNDTVTLISSQIPSHSHSPQAVNDAGGSNDPAGNYWGEATPVGRPRPIQAPYYSLSADVLMSPSALSVVGGSQPHNNMQPYLAMNFIICLNGIFPSRD